MSDITGVWKNVDQGLLIQLTWKDNVEGGEGTLYVLKGELPIPYINVWSFMSVMPMRPGRFISFRYVEPHKSKASKKRYFTYKGVQEWHNVAEETQGPVVTNHESGIYG